MRSFETAAFRIHRHGAWQAVTVKGIGRFRFKGAVDGQPKLLRVVRTPRRVELHLVVERAAERTCAVSGQTKPFWTFGAYWSGGFRA